jgi:hypothetical protein
MLSSSERRTVGCGVESAEEKRHISRHKQEVYELYPSFVTPRPSAGRTNQPTIAAAGLL